MRARNKKGRGTRTVVGEQTDDYSPKILCNADDVYVAVVDDVRAHPDVHQATAFTDVHARSTVGHGQYAFHA